MNKPTLPYTKQPAHHGKLWLIHAYKLTSRGRLMWFALIILYWLIGGVMSAIPYLGGIITTIFLPVFAVGFLAAAWAAERGKEIEVSHLFAGFKANLQALLPLGIFYLLGWTGIFIITALADGGVLLNLAIKGSALNTSDNAALTNAMLIALILFIPLMMANWFAPALVVFSDATAKQALITSFWAALANWKAFLVYGLTLFILSCFIPILVLNLFTKILGNAGLTAGLLLFVPVWLLLIPITFASSYTSYRDIFHANEKLALS